MTVRSTGRGRINVLHVTHDMGVGGAEQVLRQLVLGSDGEAFAHSIVCVDGRIGATGQSLAKRGFEVLSLSRRAGFDISLLRSLRALLRERRVDVLHCHQYTPWCYGALAAPGTGTRVVFTEHGRFHPDRSSRKRQLVNPWLVRATDALVAISAATREALVTFEHLPRGVIEVIYNGLEPPVRDPSSTSVRESLGIPPDAFVLGTIARLDPVKNQASMIDALARLHRSRPDAVLILAGDGPERDSLTRRAAGLGIAHAIRFTGFVTDIADHLDAMDVFLLTSWTEGTSMTLLEAMACGRAIVATAVGGTIEVLEDGVSGLFVPPGDVDALVGACRQLAIDPLLRERLGRDARARFDERFSSARMLEAYEALYRLSVAKA